MTLGNTTAALKSADSTIINQFNTRLDSAIGQLNRIHVDINETLMRLNGPFPQPNETGEPVVDNPGELGVLERLIQRVEELVHDYQTLLSTIRRL